MNIFDASKMPCVVTIGYDGENNWRPQSFDCASLLENHPNGTLTLWILPHSEEQAFPVALSRNGNVITWTPLSEELAGRGGALQIVCTDGTDVGKSAIALYRVSESVIPGAEHPAAVPSWATQTVERAEAAADRADSAVEHYPRIVDGTWRVWDVERETWVDTGVPAQGPQGIPGQNGSDGKDGVDGAPGADGADGVSPSVTFEAITVDGRTGNKMTVTDAEHPTGQSINILNGKDGEGSGSTITVDDALSSTSENPVQNKVINAALQTKGTYSKPSGGIPASDLATGVIPVVPQMATQQDMSDWASGKTVDASVLKGNFTYAWRGLSSLGDEMGSKANISDIPTAVSDLANDSGFQTAAQVQSAIAAAAELPAGGSTGDFLRKTANGVAWQTVPSAESNSFGGGS